MGLVESEAGCALAPASPAEHVGSNSCLGARSHMLRMAAGSELLSLGILICQP